MVEELVETRFLVEIDHFLSRGIRQLLVLRIDVFLDADMNILVVYPLGALDLAISARGAVVGWIKHIQLVMAL